MAKNLGTTISPWVVPMEALMPFAVANYPQDPEPLPYLRHSDAFNFDINLEVSIRPQDCPEEESSIVCQSNFRHMYWTTKQQLAHHSVTGCHLTRFLKILLPFDEIFKNWLTTLLQVAL